MTDSVPRFHGFFVIFSVIRVDHLFSVDGEGENETRMAHMINIFSNCMLIYSIVWFKWKLNPKVKYIYVHI